MPYIFNTINNFRDLSESTEAKGDVPERARRNSQRQCGFQPSSMSNAIWFRSATLDFATEADIAQLVSELGVKTIIDLRSEVEIKDSIESGKAFSSFPTAAASKAKISDLVGTGTAGSTKVKEHDDFGFRKTVMINFAGKRYRQKAVWKSCPLKIKFKLVYYILTKQKPRAVQLVGSQVLAKKGLQGLYYDFIDYCYEEMGRALRILADPNNYPIVIHCTQGKDRTGLVIALALLAIGVDDETIINDYAQSRAGLNAVKKEMIHEMAKDGLDSTFADAPPDVMRNALNYIRQQYGSTDSYFNRLGLTPQHRESMKHALLGNSAIPQMPTQLEVKDFPANAPIAAEALQAKSEAKDPVGNTPVAVDALGVAAC